MYKLLLCIDREIGKYTKAGSRQRLGKHVPAAKNTQSTIEVFLGYISGNCVFHVVHAEML
jgi:hypothetical protein